MMNPSGRPSISPVRQSYTAQAESQLRERVAMLQQEFAEIDANHDSWISREELYAYLDRKGNRTFDRAIADDIFDQMDKNHDNRVTINEFIKVYIQADEILKSKIDKARLMRETHRKEEEEFYQKAQRAATQEGLGGQQTGLLNAYVREVQLAPDAGRYFNLFVEIYLNNMPVAKTSVIAADTTLSWDEKFTFEIPRPDSQLKFVLLDRGTFGGATVLAEGQSHLDVLADQEMHSFWMDLVSKDKHNMQAGTLSLELQWIYSKVKYFNGLAQKSRDNAQRADEDVRDYEAMLAKLHEPFMGMQVAHETYDVMAKYPGLSGSDQKFVAGMNKLITRLNTTFGQGEKPNEEILAKFTIGVAAIEAVVGILMMFGRASFFDIVFPLIVILYIRQGSLRESFSLRIVSFMFLGSIVLLDFMWVIIFWKNWGINEYQGMDKPSKQISFIILMTLISIFLKFVLAILCYMLNIETSAVRGSVKRNMMRNIDYPQAP